jgi:predicted phage terminase large subunit-like protein
VRLHPIQKAFVESDAVYKAFVGGVGSGKSWAGAYDLIKRAKPGRLYSVISPSYQMLADSTFRSFTSLAQELGIVSEGDIKRSAPPSVTLRTGAEILFRSADNPDSLRGPNLSGIWMDEASLMPQEVFNVAIGRLREGGEQGWLSATFTPKGKKHWTFLVFGQGVPDVALFHARSSDNPFYTFDYAGRLRKDYTSALAAQEVEGQFLDLEGALFQRHWFPVVHHAPPFLVAFVRAWDLAATPKDETKASDPDWTCGLLMGKAGNGDNYILDVRRLRGTPQQVQSLVRRTAEEDRAHVAIYMEQEPGSAGKIVIDTYLRLLAGFTFHGERSTGSKADRAQPLAAQAEGGAVKLVRAPWNKDFLDEAEVFPYGPHDDIVDCASLAFAKLASRQRTHPQNLPAVLVAGRANVYGDGTSQPLPDLSDPSPYEPDWNNCTGPGGYPAWLDWARQTDPRLRGL